MVAAVRICLHFTAAHSPQAYVCIHMLMCLSIKLSTWCDLHMPLPLITLCLPVNLQCAGCWVGLAQLLEEYVEQV
jgi:hypothetical protein